MPKVPRRTVAGLSVVAALVGLVGCQASPSVKIDSAGTSCVTGQAFVMELSDDDPSAYGAQTVVRAGGCSGDQHSTNYYWSSIRVQAEKWSEVYGICGRTPRKTGYGTGVSIGQSDYCDHGRPVSRVYVYSTNEAHRGSWMYQTPFTPLVTTT